MFTVRYSRSIHAKSGSRAPDLLLDENCTVVMPQKVDAGFIDRFRIAQHWPTQFCTCYLGEICHDRSETNRESPDLQALLYPTWGEESYT